MWNKMVNLKSFEEEIGRILAAGREMAKDAVLEVVCDSFEEIADLVLEKTGGIGGDTVVAESAFLGVRKEFWKNLAKCINGGSGSVRDWLLCLPEIDMMNLLSDFLDFYSVKMKNFREKYPMAFVKWSEEEDGRLLEAYRNAGDGTIPWAEISRAFGRNTNALKLRLAHLGIDLGDAAVKPRYV